MPSLKTFFTLKVANVTVSGEISFNQGDINELSPEA